jgi:hypothetical protein
MFLSASECFSDKQKRLPVGAVAAKVTRIEDTAVGSEWTEK